MSKASNVLDRWIAASSRNLTQYVRQVRMSPWVWLAASPGPSRHRGTFGRGLLAQSCACGKRVCSCACTVTACVVKHAPASLHNVS